MPMPPEFTSFLWLGIGLLLAYLLTIKLRALGLVQHIPAAVIIATYGIYSDAEPSAMLSYALLSALVMATCKVPQYRWPLRIVTLIAGLAIALRLLPSLPTIGPVATHTFSQLSGQWSIYGGINKAFVGLLLLPLVNWPSIHLAECRRYGLILLTGPLIIVALAYLTGIAFDFKLSTFTLLFAFANLSYVVVAEEVFFRGLIQQYLCAALPKRNSVFTGIISASVIFGIAHIAGGLHYVLLSICAGGLYGYCYWRLKSLWAAVYTHLAVNIFHMVLLQYPLPA